MKKLLLTVLQLVLGLGLIAAIALRLHHTGQLDDLRIAFASTLTRWPLLLLAFAGFGNCLLLCAFRWQLVLHAQGFATRFSRVLRLYLVGQFFNAFMLGATGGDVMKAIYVARDSADRKTEIIATVFIERMIGLVAIVVLAPIAMLMRLPLFWGRPETRALLLLALGLAAASLTGFALLFGRDLFDRWPWLRRLENRAAGRILRRTYTAFHAVLRHRGLLTRATALSVLNHLSFILTAFAIGLALGLPLGYLDYLAAFLPVNLIAAIPITPSGIGTREAASILLLGTLGVAAAPAVTLSLLLYATVLAWSLVGGALFACGGLRSKG